MSSQPETSQHDAADQHAPGDGPDVDESSGPPYRAIAMVLLAAVVVAIGIGLAQLFSGGDDSTPAAVEETTTQSEQGEQPGQAVEPGPQGEPAQPGGTAAGQDGQGAPGEGLPGLPEQQQPGSGQQPSAGQPAPGPAVTAVPVQIFNNSNVTGLAGRTGETLRESGFAVGDVANLPSNQGVVSESTAYFGSGPGEQQAAEAIAAQLGIPVKPRPANMAVETPGVIVIVTQDLDR
ncbi:LytR C-terminal domain-containing protein [Rhodococcus sp. IEGM 1408]|uniref:LytR C-terminal domain-containing protein n=1 Tax=Rhodococcus sp. IEGM 1408 TaxID=3082220 RepID=UPI002953A849|nr:LytR C-terminal domain-containing protein [Rhodococcus sp. IEGM 1408]MDV8001614.1 LytR C-terminal domain-containing protein [Rhodococcus sp. IEGM 1408]